MANRRQWISILFALIATSTLFSFFSSSWALIAGIAFALTIGNPFPTWVKRWTAPILQLAVVGLGAGTNLEVIGQVGLQGIGYTLAGITLALLAGTFLGFILRISPSISVLISSGTAICGGSAIAAISSAIRSESAETSIALATVFLLNAAGLFLFPWIGHALELSEIQFGLWSALAIHDTSSVVGAALQYGPHALEIATTVKLARALWIVPLTLLIGWIWNRKRLNSDSESAKVKKPWFILGFILMAAIMTWIPALQTSGVIISSIAKRLLVLSLFLIGSGLTRATLQKVGVKPLVQALLLWILVASSSLQAIRLGWIH